MAAFRVDLIWFVLHVIVKAQMTTSKCKHVNFAAVPIFSNVLEGSKWSKLQDPRKTHKLRRTAGCVRGSATVNPPPILRGAIAKGNSPVSCPDQRLSSHFCCQFSCHFRGLALVIAPRRISSGRVFLRNKISQRKLPHTCNFRSRPSVIV